MENVLGEVAQKIEVDVEEEKDLYHVQVFLLLYTSAYYIQMDAFYQPLQNMNAFYQPLQNNWG